MEEGEPPTDRDNYQTLVLSQAMNISYFAKEERTGKDLEHTPSLARSQLNDDAN